MNIAPRNDGSQTIKVNAQHYDSRPIGRKYGEKHFALCMDAIARNAKVHDYTAERGSYEEKGDLPKQQDAHCGVYMLAFTEYHSLGYEILDFEDDNMPFFRVKYAYELMTSDYIFAVGSNFTQSISEEEIEQES